VFNVIVHYLDSVKVAACDSEELWLCCRFVHLSSEKQVVALQHKMFPQKLFFEDFIAFNAIGTRSDIDMDATFSPNSIKRVALRTTPYLLQPFMLPELIVRGNMIIFSNAPSIAFKVLPETHTNVSQPIDEFDIPEGWCVVKTNDPDFHLIRQNIIKCFRESLTEDEDSLHDHSYVHNEKKWQICVQGKEDVYGYYLNGNRGQCKPFMKVDEHQPRYRIDNRHSKLLVRAFSTQSSNKRQRI